MNSWVNSPQLPRDSGPQQEIRSPQELNMGLRFRRRNLTFVHSPFYAALVSLNWFYQRVMGYINSGKAEGATVHVGGERHGQEGYFIQPTIFTDTKPDMKIIREEIFGPVAAIIKFKTEEGQFLRSYFITYSDTFSY